MERLQSEFRTLREVSSLTYEQLEVEIVELNRLCRIQLAGQASQLLFVIRRPPQQLSLLWKALVRVECRKLESATNRLLDARVLSLRQLLSLKRDLRTLSQLPGGAVAANSEGPVTDFTASVVIDCLRRDEVHEVKMSGGAPTDLEECCICMDRQADVLLECAHAYCQPCIQRWLDGGAGGLRLAATLSGAAAAATCGGTCPVCRTLVNSTDGWVIAAPPEDVGPASLMLDAALRAGRADSQGRPE